jgi:hypothetical protein
VPLTYSAPVAQTPPSAFLMLTSICALVLLPGTLSSSRGGLLHSLACSHCWGCCFCPASLVAMMLVHSREHSGSMAFFKHLPVARDTLHIGHGRAHVFLVIHFAAKHKTWDIKQLAALDMSSTMGYNSFYRHF